MSDAARPQFDLQELVNEYGLGAVTSVRKAEGGEVNENWIVRAAKGTVVVRSVAKSRSLEDTRFEHSFIRALARAGFPYRMPQPLRTRSGRTVVMRNGTYVWLYNYIEGSNSRPRRDVVIAQMARAMALAHVAGRRVSLRQANGSLNALDHPWLLQTLRRWQLKLVNDSKEHHRFFSAHVQECIGILEQLRCTCYGALPRLPIHGDMCRANLVFSGDRLRGILDFGHSCWDTAIRDVTIALRYECAEPRDRSKLDVSAARRFLKFYVGINPLTREEIELIPAIAMAESADLFWYRMVQSANKRGETASIRLLEDPFEALRWYHRHQREIARALRM
jgi:Ser/Thr protein kinase RdoA (MazF antagonist)